MDWCVLLTDICLEWITCTRSYNDFINKVFLNQSRYLIATHYSLKNSFKQTVALQLLDWAPGLFSHHEHLMTLL
jgi:hypothetical protein